MPSWHVRTLEEQDDEKSDSEGGAPDDILALPGLLGRSYDCERGGAKPVRQAR